MVTRIDTVEARSKLKPRSEPYWIRIAAGCHLGFRRLTPTSTGTWIAKYRDPDSAEREKKSLGEFTNRLPSQRYDAAREAAEAWFRHLGSGGSSEVITVQAACDQYVEHVRSQRGDKPANDIAARYRRRIEGSALACIPLPKLTRGKVENWHSALAGLPHRVNRSPKAEPVMRPRAPSSLNRDATALRAALNYAHDCGQVSTDMAWRVALRPIKNADRRREGYLDRDQRMRLIQHAAPDVSALLRGLSLLPLRPGALAALRVSNYDPRLHVLKIGKDKSGQDRKIKVPDVIATFLGDQCLDKAPEVPLFVRDNGKPWDKDAWKWPVKHAAEGAKLPATTTAYTIRHSVISDLVHDGLDLLTVAQISGTSVLMIERHYGHLRSDIAAAALARLAL
jgi:site-specific recombinase XerD